jgi:hypothetical protein
MMRSEGKCEQGREQKTSDDEPSEEEAERQKRQKRPEELKKRSALDQVVQAERRLQTLNLPTAFGKGLSGRETMTTSRSLSFAVIVYLLSSQSFQVRLVAVTQF